MFVDDATQVLLPITPYLVLLLLLAAVWAFRNRETRLGRWRYGVLALVLWSGCLSTPAIGNALVGRIEAPYPPVASVSTTARPLVVVLSTGCLANSDDPGDPGRL